MAFRPRVNDSIHIDQRKLTFSEHPSAPGMPYGQTGRRATVYQLAGQNGERYALKVFTAAFRSRQVEEQAGQLAGYAQLPGLTACEREVISLRRHASLVGQHAELEDAVLMPWIQGMTWQEVVMNRQAVTRGQSLMLAENLVRILAVMEQNGIAHCDLSAPNVIVNFTALGVGNGGGSSMELIDLEDMYAPGMGRPEKLPAGSAGYAHRRAVEGVWEAPGDRFAGAVLLAEMLGWCDERVRSGAFGEQYFDMSEMQQECSRFHLLLERLAVIWGAEVKALFDRAWRSATMDECPSFAEWGRALNVDIPDLHCHHGQAVLPVRSINEWRTFVEPAAREPFSASKAVIIEKAAINNVYKSPVNQGNQTEEPVYERAGQVEGRKINPWIIVILLLVAGLILIFVTGQGRQSSRSLNYGDPVKSQPPTEAASASSSLNEPYSNNPTTGMVKSTATTTNKVKMMLPELHSVDGCKVSSRLQAGDLAYISFGGGRNSIRSEPNTVPADNKIGYAETGQVLIINGNPQCDIGGYLLWNVSPTFSASWKSGWTPEVAEPIKEYWISPAPYWKPCGNSEVSHLDVGFRAYVSMADDTANRVRKNPGANADIMARIDPGEEIDIVDGPQCLDGLIWWKVKNAFVEGWTAEGSGGEFWLIPIYQP